MSAHRCGPCSTKAGHEVLLPAEAFSANGVARGVCRECRREQNRRYYDTAVRKAANRAYRPNPVPLLRPDRAFQGAPGESLGRVHFEGFSYEDSQ